MSGEGALLMFAWGVAAGVDGSSLAIRSWRPVTVRGIVRARGGFRSRVRKIVEANGWLGFKNKDCQTRNGISKCR